MNSELLHGFYLGDLFIEPLKGRVSGKEEPRHLPPKAVEVLLCLSRSAGEMVTREALLEAAWGKGNGSTEALSHTISEIRHALDDHADDPVFIQTLPRVGYRLAVTPQMATEHTGSIVIGTPGGPTVHDIGLFENLKRRGVLETAIAYSILGWLLIQVADVVFAQLGFPPWTARFVTVLVIAGFPVALVLSWFLEFRDGRAVLDELSPDAARKRRFSHTYQSVVGSLAIAAVLVYIFDLTFGLPRPEERPRLPPVVENSIGVLPFMNLDGSRETQIFADGLMEDVITQLSRVPGLRVASRGDSATMAPNSASRDVRKRLRVEMYLEGSVEMSTDEMRVTVQLIDSGDGFHVLSRRFDRPREDFFSLRDEITSLTVANVRVALPPDVGKSAPWILENPSLDAYVLYRQGIDASRQPRSIDSISSALGWFDAALALDPEYAAAHAAKCAVFVDGYAEVDDPAYIERAELSCATALSLNPNLDVVYTSLGDLYLSTGRHSDAEVAYQRALAGDPSNAAALSGLGRAYQRLNRPKEAEAMMRRATDIHPGDAAPFNDLGVYLSQTGRFAEAATQFQYAAALRPEDPKYLTNLGSAYMLQGDFRAAARAFENAIGIAPTKNTYGSLGLMQYYLGNYEAAVESQRRAVALQPNDYLARMNLGDTLLAAHRIEEALQALADANEMATGALQVNPNDPFIIMDLAWIKTGLGDHEVARDFIDRALEMVPDDPYVHYINGLILNRTGNTSETFVALETAVELGYSTVMLAGDPNITNLRGDSRLGDILKSAE